MAPTPKFVQRAARLPEVLALLAAYPAGLPLRVVADRFGTDARTLREDLTTYLDLESWGWSFDLFRRSVVEFVQPEAEDLSDPDGSTVVRVVDDSPAGLGVEHLSAGDLAVIYTAGTALLDVSPDDTDLAEALAVLADTMYGEPASQPRPGGWNSHLAPLRAARDEQRRVRIVYSRAWQEGVTERVIEPLRLVQTKRGWEVDAGPVGPEGNLRTYILSNLRELEVLEETFERPSGVERLLERQRETTTARVELAQDARWAADMYAEQVTVVSEDEDVLTADLELLPPAGERVGLVMLASGPSTRLIKPMDLLPEAVGVINRLAEHHAQEPTEPGL